MTYSIAIPSLPIAPIREDRESVDVARFLKLVDGDRDLMHQLIAIFAEDGIRLLNDIGGAIDSGNARALRLSAHALQGSAGYFGATKVCDAAQQLERMGFSGDLTNAAVIYSRLTDAVEHLQGVLGEL